MKRTLQYQNEVLKEPSHEKTNNLVFLCRGSKYLNGGDILQDIGQTALNILQHYLPRLILG